MQSQLYTLLDLEYGIEGSQQGEATAPGRKPGQDVVSAKPHCQDAQEPWSVLQYKLILDIDETLLSNGEISAVIKVIVSFGLMGSEML